MLNAIDIKNLKPKLSAKGKPKTYRVADTGGCRGLGVHVTPTGHKSYSC